MKKFLSVFLCLLLCAGAAIPAAAFDEDSETPVAVTIRDGVLTLCSSVFFLLNEPMTAGELQAAFSVQEAVSIRPMDTSGGVKIPEKLEKDAPVGTGATISFFSGYALVTDGNTFQNRIILLLAGDLDGDAAVTAADARLALRASVGLFTDVSSSMQRACISCAGDLNGDSAVQADDARDILRASVGLTTLPSLTALWAKAEPLAPVEQMQVRYAKNFAYHDGSEEDQTCFVRLLTSREALLGYTKCFRTSFSNSGHYAPALVLTREELDSRYDDAFFAEHFLLFISLPRSNASDWPVFQGVGANGVVSVQWYCPRFVLPALNSSLCLVELPRTYLPAHVRLQISSRSF